MERKENTSIRKARRQYEEKHKAERKAANKVWGTSIPRALADEIDEFLTAHNLSKVALINEGYQALRMQYEKEN